MRPLDLQPIGNETAIKWNDGSESSVPLGKTAAVLSSHRLFKVKRTFWGTFIETRSDRCRRRRLNWFTSSAWGICHPAGLGGMATMEICTFEFLWRIAR
jgi:hypothetical protein